MGWNGQLIINAVNSDDHVLRRIVEDYDIFKGEKIYKKEIFKTIDIIKKSTIEKLQQLIYHNLNVILPLYKKGLHIDFSSRIIGLHEAIRIRHDIVHRNGRDFSGKTHKLTIKMINDLLNVTSETIDFINHEFNQKGIKIRKNSQQGLSGDEILTIQSANNDTDDLPF